MTIQIVPATQRRWFDVVEAFGPQARRADSCWCQRFTEPSTEDNRTALHRELTTADVPVGLLALLDDAAAGWTRVVPRSTLPGITGNRAIRRLLPEDPRAWWVSCVAVRREHRGAGVGAALLTGAVDWARQHGASMLDGHPVDTAVLRGRPSPSALFTGTVAMFAAAGFEEVGRTFPSRPVMRRHL